MAGAQRNQRLQSGAELAQLFDLQSDFAELRDGLRAHHRTVGGWIGPQRQQLTNLPQGKAQLLGLPDESDAF